MKKIIINQQVIDTNLTDDGSCLPKGLDDSMPYLLRVSPSGYTDGEDWEGKKLEKVKCKCKNGDKGHTLRCRDNGSYESYTQTQQGLGGCYSVSLFPPSGSLLCEGEEVEKYDGE